ncbi:MAG: hypothetical protein WB542_17785, partial [Polaromonas sp.]
PTLTIGLPGHGREVLAPLAPPSPMTMSASNSWKTSACNFLNSMKSSQQVSTLEELLAPDPPDFASWLPPACGSYVASEGWRGVA